MKKIIFLIFLIPTIVFGNKITSDDLIGLEFRIGGKTYFKLNKEGNLFSRKNTAEPYKNHFGKWEYFQKNNKLAISTDWGTKYIVDFSSIIRFYGIIEISTKWVGINKTNSGSSSTIFLKNSKRNYFLKLLRSVGLNINYDLKIEKYINNKIKDWELQGEFEKTINYNERVNTISLKEKRELLKKEAINFYKKSIIDKIIDIDIELGKYNPDNETFMITISLFEAINFPVPISKAESFKKNFNPSTFSNLDFIYAQGEFIVSQIDINGLTYDLFSSE